MSSAISARNLWSVALILETRMVKMLDTHLSGCPLIPLSERDDGTTCPDRRVCRMFAEGKVMLARSEERGYYLVTC